MLSIFSIPSKRSELCESAFTDLKNEKSKKLLLNIKVIKKNLNIQNLNFVLLDKPFKFTPNNPAASFLYGVGSKSTDFPEPLVLENVL